MDLRQLAFVFISCNVFFQLCYSYQKYKLESYKLCASKLFKHFYDVVVHPPEIILGKGQDSAVIITQKWNSTSASRLRSSCSFNVKSSIPDSEFFIVITKLNFRKTASGCYDFIQFNHGGTKSQKICESVGGEYGQTHPIFGKRVKEFEVDINVEKGIALNENLELEMVITAAHECPTNVRSNTRDVFQCDENDNFSCISRRFLDDGIVNCFPPCRDENACVPEVISVQNPDVSSIALTAIISLILTMLAVGTCAWICWKYKSCLRREGTSQSADEPTIEIPHTVQERHVNNSQSLPRPPSPKDLPPSYESLFPDR